MTQELLACLTVPMVSAPRIRMCTFVNHRHCFVHSFSNLSGNDQFSPVLSPSSVYSKILASGKQFDIFHFILSVFRIECVSCTHTIDTVAQVIFSEIKCSLIPERRERDRQRVKQRQTRERHIETQTERVRVRETETESSCM